MENRLTRSVALLALSLASACNRVHDVPPADAAPLGVDAPTPDAAAPDDAAPDDAGAPLIPPVTSCAPVLHESVGDPCFCRGPIVVYGGALYRQSVGVEVYDLADPLAPVRVGTLEEPPASEGGLAVVDGHLLSVANFGPLHVYDLADPLAPRHVAELALSGSPIAVALSGRTATLALGLETGAGAVAVLDLADLEHPVVTATIDLPDLPQRVQMNDEHAFVLTYHPEAVVIEVDLVSHELSYHDVDSDSPTAMTLDGETLFVLVGNGMLRAFDVGGGAFAPVGALEGLGEYPSALEVRGGRAIVAGYGGLFVIDARDPADMRVAGRAEPPLSGTWIASAGDTAWLSSGNNVSAVELNCAM